MTTTKQPSGNAMSTKTATPAPVMTEAEAARLTDREEQDLARAQAELARAKTQGNKEIAKGKIAKIDRLRRNRVDAVWRRNSLHETVGLAEERGEDVDTKPPAGAAHMISRDALGHMLKLGHITRPQYLAGLAYRRAFEARGADLQASQISDASGGRGHDNDAFVARKMEQAFEAELAKECEVEIRKATMVEHLPAVQMLQHVAGLGRSMRDFGGGRGFERRKAALAFALDLIPSVVEAYRSKRERRAEALSGLAAMDGETLP